MSDGRITGRSNPPVRLPEDAPLDGEGRKRHDEHRLDPVIDALHGHLASWLCTSTRKRRRMTPPRIGLFGGLGQGKSTVVCNVIERMQAPRTYVQRLRNSFRSTDEGKGHPAGRTLGTRVRDMVLGPRIAHFDVSYFKADDLEWRFLTAVLWHRVLHNFFAHALIFFILLSVVVGLHWAAKEGWNLIACASDPDGCILWLRHKALGDWSLTTCAAHPAACWDWIQGAAAAAWATLRNLAGWAAVSVLVVSFIPLVWNKVNGARAAYKSVDPATGLYLAHRDRLVQIIARSVSALPYIIVVDDLDRAAVAQQRAFLRALSRFSRELGFALVVCMDESDFLATDPNPEAPEDLLHKAITVELRVPERTREDIAFLAAVCAREFARENPPQDAGLAASLTSVQFVSDLMRTLILTAAEAPANPRTIRRILTGVAQQASQIGVSDADDLSALMRIEGIYRLVPPLRRQPDALRKILERNRVDLLEQLLKGLDLKEGRRDAAMRFFQRTRMMRPSMRDGWFRLLGGLPDHGSCTREAWRSQWPMAARSLEFFRLFAEAVELDAEGYRHDLRLEVFVPPTPRRIAWWRGLWSVAHRLAHGQSKPSPQAGYKFAVPGGSIETFADCDLPEAFRSLGTSYLAQCWLLWVCTLVTTTEPASRRTMYRRGHAWIKGTPERTDLLDLFWRECLADAGTWESLNAAERHGFWCRIREDIEETDGLWASLVARGRLFGISLAQSDFADAWSLLGHPIGNDRRDGRSILFWLHGLVPEIRVSSIGRGGETYLAAEVWPAPQPQTWDAKGWREVLTQHFRALVAINTAQRSALIPDPLHHAWCQAQSALTAGDCLDLIYLLAYEPTQPAGQRWGTESMRDWVTPVGKRSPPDLRALAGCLDAAAADGTPRAPLETPILTPQQRSALVLVAVLLDWRPKDGRALVRNAPEEVLGELCQTLKDQGTIPDWLRQTGV